MPPYESLPYRPCVGMMVLNKDGLVFIGRRADGPEHVDETHVWQMPGKHKPEFIAWRWEKMRNLPDLIIPFKRPVYERVVKEFAPFARPPRSS